MFVWKKEFELGIKSIDEQHKKLLDIGNQINELILDYSDSHNNFTDIYNLIEELKNYTVYHFDTEEELFIKYNYSDYENHKKEHDKFVDYLDSIDLNHVDENQKEFLNELLNKIVQWVFRHIITTDFLYKDYLIKLGTKWFLKYKKGKNSTF